VSSLRTESSVDFEPATDRGSAAERSCSGKARAGMAGPGRVGTRSPIPEVTTEGLRAEHPEVGDHAAARGVGPKDR